VSDQLLLRETDQGVARLTLNRPAKFNALSEELLAELKHTLSDIRDNEDIAAVVLAANGKAFCAGHDLRQMRASHSAGSRASDDNSYYQNLFSSCSQVMQLIGELPQPVIAEVQGIATAAGCQLVATCDLAVAAQSARFAVSGINLGLFCSTPAVALSRNISRKRAFEMLLTGDFIDADTAAEYGLINYSVEDSALRESTETLALKIASKPLAARKVGKHMFYHQLSKDLPNAYAFSGNVMANNMMDSETVEHIDAFLEKRPVRKT